MASKMHWPGWQTALKTLAGSDLSTRNLATAVALGALVAPTPVLGLHTWMAIGLAFLFRVNRLAAFIGSNIANPLTMAPLVWADIQIGARLLGRPGPTWKPDDFNWEWVRGLYLEAWAGALVLGMALALLAGGITTLVLNRTRRSRGSA
jgi:uncharacterized protein (DUF2062 family)